MPLPPVHNILDVYKRQAYAYSTMYQKIVEGYRNGTREVYVCDDSESGKRRLLSMDEELEKLKDVYKRQVQVFLIVLNMRMIRRMKILWC